MMLSQNAVHLVGISWRYRQLYSETSVRANTHDQAASSRKPMNVLSAGMAISEMINYWVVACNDKQDNSLSLMKENPKFSVGSQQR